MRRRGWWTERVRGGAAFLEVTYNAETGQWHPHLHIVCDAAWLAHDELSAEWHHVTRTSHVVDVKLVRNPDAVASYVVKYAAKPLSDTFLNRPDQLQEAIRAFTGRRFALTFGDWRGLHPEIEYPPGDWITVASLNELIARRAAGDDDAATILAALEARRAWQTKLPRTSQTHGPPEDGEYL